MASQTALVIVIFGLLLLNGAALFVAYLVFKSVIERFDMFIQQKQIAESVDDEPLPTATAPRMRFKRAKPVQTTPTLVETDGAEAAAADIVQHKDETTDGNFKNLDEIDRAVLSEAVDKYRGYMPEPEATNTKEAV